jgi:hypothetical protein
MAPVYLYGGSVLLRDGAVAVDEACCCGGGGCPCYCQIANPQPSLCFQPAASLLAVVCNNANPELASTITFRGKFIAGGLCHFFWSKTVAACTWNDGYQAYPTEVQVDVSCLANGLWRVSVLVYNPYLALNGQQLFGFKDVNICVDGTPANLHGTVSGIDMGPNPFAPPARLLVSLTFNTAC